MFHLKINECQLLQAIFLSNNKYTKHWMEEIKCVSIVSDLVTIENPFDQSYKLGNLFTKRG